MKRGNNYIKIKLSEKDLDFIDNINIDPLATKLEKRRARLLLKIYNNSLNYFEKTETSIANKEQVSLQTLVRLKTQFNETNSIEQTIKRKNYKPFTTRQKINPNLKKEIINIALATPPRSKKHWSYRMISNHYNQTSPVKVISHTTVRKILNSNNISLK
jgi:hypothetical protein